MEIEEAPLLWYLITYCGFQPTKRYPSGRVLGLCPFHQERHASFNYYPATDQRAERFTCYGCKIYGKLPRLIAVKECGLSWDAPLDADVRARQDAILAEFVADGGHIPEPVSTTASPSLVSYPGPLTRVVLNRLAAWWHTQLFRESAGAQAARAYLRQRGVEPEVFRDYPIIGYMPKEAELDTPTYLAFQRLYSVTETELAQERRWYQEQAEIREGDLPFLASARQFAEHLGLLTKEGAWPLQHALLFCCLTGKGECRFYQARWLRHAALTSGYKFLNPPIQKYPFCVDLAKLAGNRSPIFTGTVIVESPFGPLLNAMHGLTRYGVATLGTGEFSLGTYQNLPQPFWLAHDNDHARFLVNGEWIFPGETQAEQAYHFFRTGQMQARRLRPWKSLKGYDEMLNHPVGRIALMRTLYRYSQEWHLPVAPDWAFLGQKLSIREKSVMLAQRECG